MSIEVDLSGPSGNAFALMGMARRWAKQLDREWAPILERLTSGDYRNMVYELKKEFGDSVKFVNAPWDDQEEEES